MTDVGWEVGKIVGRSRGVWAVKYPTDRRQYLHDLNIEDYGSVWVVVEKCIVVIKIIQRPGKGPNSLSWRRAQGLIPYRVLP